VIVLFRFDNHFPIVCRKLVSFRDLNSASSCATFAALVKCVMSTHPCLLIWSSTGRLEVTSSLDQCFHHATSLPNSTRTRRWRTLHETCSWRKSRISTSRIAPLSLTFVLPTHPLLPATSTMSSRFVIVCLSFIPFSSHCSPDS
jgi:hypothetical protein